MGACLRKLGMLTSPAVLSCFSVEATVMKMPALLLLVLVCTTIALCRHSFS